MTCNTIGQDPSDRTMRIRREIESKSFLMNKSKTFLTNYSVGVFSLGFDTKAHRTVLIVSLVCILATAN